MTIDVPDALHKRFKKVAVDKEKTMRQLMLDLIEEMVVAHEKGEGAPKKGN